MHKPSPFPEIKETLEEGRVHKACNTAQHPISSRGQAWRYPSRPALRCKSHLVLKYRCRAQRPSTNNGSEKRTLGAPGEITASSSLPLPTHAPPLLISPPQLTTVPPPLSLVVDRWNSQRANLLSLYKSNLEDNPASHIYPMAY